MDMQTQTNDVDLKIPHTRGARKPKGRKNADKQEAIISMLPVKESIEELVALHIKAGEASDKFSEAVKATAEKAGLLASVVRKFVQARAGEKFEEKKTECDQLSLVFEEVGQHFA